MARILVTKKLIAELKYIDTEQFRPGEYYFPDFLIIGPQRTGTTWLQHNLALHPEIFIPPDKELFFFSNLIVKGLNKNYTSDRLEWYSRKISPRKMTNILHVAKENVKNIMRNKTIKDQPERIAGFLSSSLAIGEATASYATMDEGLIKEIFTLHPDVKILMFIRHPYERAWSHAKKDLVRERGLSFEEISNKDFLNFFADDYQIRCGFYSKIIQTWKKYIKTGNLFIGIFDDIGRDPRKILLDVFSYLGVSANETYIQDATSSSVINPTISKKIPKELLAFLKEYFGEEIVKLNKMFGLNWQVDQ